MVSPGIPWIALSECNTDSSKTIAQLYEPYEGGIARWLRPASVTMCGWEPPRELGPGLSTSLWEVSGTQVLCNFLQPMKGGNPQLVQTYAKHTMAIDTELAGRLLYHTSLEVSDVVCIRARTALEAARTVISFRDCLDRNTTHAEARFIVFLEVPSCALEAEEGELKSLVQKLCTPDPTLAQWDARVQQQLAVRPDQPDASRPMQVLHTIATLVVSEMRRRQQQSHLWTVEQFTYLLEQYFTADSPLGSSRPDAVWHPMAFRRQYWPGADLQKHSALPEWLRRADKAADLNSTLAPIFARMFLQDSQILSHDFPPLELFASIYEPLCRKAWAAAARRDGALARQSLPGFLTAVASQMGHHGHGLHRGVKTGPAAIQTQSLCPMCPWDMAPEVFFPCGHGICARDAWLQSGTRPDETQTRFAACPVCDTVAETAVRHRPLQAGYRVAAFDGGGTLVASEIAALQRIVEGEDMPTALAAHHYIDLAVGTSAGSIITAAVFIMKWPLDDCIKSFRSTAQAVFVKERGLRGLLTRLLRIRKDGAQYDIEAFAKVLKGKFGDRLMQSNLAHTSAGNVRVAVTATTFDSKLCLFRSYGDVLQEENPGQFVTRSYPHLRLWQAVATSCAVPPMFEPLRAHPDQSPQNVFDGMFTANCPAWVAMKELNDLSMLETRQLDFAVSFGTGRCSGDDQRRSRKWLKSAIPEWVQRVTCCLGGAVDADAMYERFLHTMDGAEKQKHHRVRPQFTGVPVAPDDPTCIPCLEEQTDRYMKLPATAKGTHRLRLAMLASCFYGAFLSQPTFDSRIGQYSVKLAILSRWPEDETIGISLAEKLKMASFLVDGKPSPYRDRFNCTVLIPNWDTPIDLRLRLENDASYPISGFPLSIRQLIYLQPPAIRKRRHMDLTTSSAKRQRSA